MLLTVYSSFSLGIVSYYGYMYNNWTGKWYMILMITSIINHTIIKDEYTRASKYEIINTFDKILCRYIILRTVYTALLIKWFTFYVIPYWMSLFWIIYISYYLTPGLEGELYHCSMHFAAAFGTTCLNFHMVN
jgi:hypothetical protein